MTSGFAPARANGAQGPLHFGDLPFMVHATKLGWRSRPSCRRGYQIAYRVIKLLDRWGPSADGKLRATLYEKGAVRFILRPAGEVNREEDWKSAFWRLAASLGPPASTITPTKTQSQRHSTPNAEPAELTTNFLW